MFQRLKGAIDSRIAEEQARQRQAAAAANASTRTASSQPHRQPGQNGAPGRTRSRQREGQEVSTEKGPDPADFEPEFAVGEDESAVPSRTGTPLPDVKEKPAEKEGETAGDGDIVTQQPVEGKPENTNGGPAPPPKPAELPTELRVKLRKLERLEGRYQDLLRAYRTAHARIQLIEPFEVSLRENTPLTSISDPGALVEYLNQNKLKSDMVLDELKRVSSDRDDYKKKFRESENVTSELRNEVAELKAKAATSSDDKEADTRSLLEVKTDESKPIDTLETAVAVKSPTPSTSSRVPSFSLFSPKSKPKTLPTKDIPEELFSYDSEIPRLELEVQERQTEIEGLKKQLDAMKGDLAVARESTESMVQSLESATRELHGLRDAKDKFESTKSEMQSHIDELQLKVDESGNACEELRKQIEGLQSERDKALQDLEAAEAQNVAATKSEGEAKERSSDNEKAASILKEKLAQKDATVKDLEDTLAMYKSAERQEAKQAEEGFSSEKRIATMQNIMDSLKTQLKSATTTVADLKQDISAKQDEFAKRPSTKVFGFLDDQSDPGLNDLDNRDAAVRYLAEKFDLRQVSDVRANPIETHTPTPQAESAGAGKKKNKKKKKGKGTLSAAPEGVEHDSPVKVTEDLADADDEPRSMLAASAGGSGEIQKEIDELRQQIELRNETIDRLSAQLKDQEAMREEIETLRDDLLHQGEEHVEARDALKEAQMQKKTLKDAVSRLEKELGESQTKLASGADTENAYTRLVADFEEMKTNSTALQTDLTVVEKLATDRFNEMVRLQKVLSEAQPEMQRLRKEVADLISVKEDLKNKSGELSRLEARHEDLKAEMKGLSKRLGDKDSEIKELNQKFERETASRSRAESDLSVTQSDLRYSEARKQETVESAAQMAKDLSKVKEEASSLKSRLRDLDGQISTHSTQMSDLREELSLKIALHNTSQSFVQSLRDQTHELSTQARESSTRAESLEEELADVQRMLSERTQDCHKMRLLLSQAETGTEARIREMKERMETAVEERDRVEDEASLANRRMTREVEEARGKARDLGRQVKVLENEKEEVDGKLREMRRTVMEVESVGERSGREVVEVRSAMERLREALDESERQVGELEGLRTGMRKELEEMRERVEKLVKSNKALSEEMKGMGQHGVPRKASVRPSGMDSGVQSSRSSFDSATGGLRSPGPRDNGRSPASMVRSETPTGPNAGGVDYVYLKNVLLQFLEQRDKNHQKQLVPVLGMLLHFDRKDEQKWMAAISAK